MKYTAKNGISIQYSPSYTVKTNFAHTRIIFIQKEKKHGSCSRNAIQKEITTLQDHKILLLGLQLLHTEWFL
jgi:hypothetical protein